MATPTQTTTLRISDLKLVINTLWDARSKWFDIGIELERTPDDLEAIKAKCNSSPDTCFREMLTEWLRDKSSKWEHIVTALRAKPVGYGKLAKEVEETYLAQQHSIAAEVQSLNNPGNILFQCPCGDCTLDSYISEGCPKLNSESKSYAQLKVRNLKDGDKEDLMQKLTHDTTQIKRHFAQLLVKTANSFQEQGVHIHTLAHAALSIGTHQSGEIPTPFLPEEEKELLKADTIDSAFILLEKHMSFFNYDILEHIIDSLGSDDDKGRLKHYEECLTRFCERKTFEVPPSVFHSESGMKGREAFLVLITKKIEFSLNDVREAKRKLATKLGLKSSTLKLHRIDEGSLVLLFSIPESVARMIFPLKPSELIKLKAEGFIIIGHNQCRNRTSTPLDGVIARELSIEWYKSKFCALLDCEEKAHSEVLKARCDGQYQLFLLQQGLKQLPQSTLKDPKFRHTRYGYLVGLNGDQVAYAVQAAQDKQGIVIHSQDKEICNADILPENYTHTDDKMYIGFDRDNHLKLHQSALGISTAPTFCCIKVKFELKHKYFDTLRRFVRSIPEDVIQKLIPPQTKFLLPFEKTSTYFAHCKPLCSPDQFEALKAIVFSPPSGPPIVIAGPFGTGKTYSLAVAVQALFHEGVLGNKFLKILVCTHHKHSTDNFLEIYKNLRHHFPLNRNTKIFLIRNYGIETTSWQVKQYCITVSDVLYRIRNYPNTGHTNFLFVTTCMTCSQMVTLKGFFTHVMIDEGAQMREPEAIAPLCLVDNATKIVITGDHQQVGPSMLVLGDKTRQYGLDKSLLERLSYLYQEHIDITTNHLLILSTNYRCNPAIRKFARDLFYCNFDLKSPQQYQLPQPHPRYPNCLLFVCSSIERNIVDIDSNINEKEATILLKVLKDIAFFNWPREWGMRDLLKCCIMSPCRSQLTVINQLIRDWSKGYSMLRKVCRRPTYDIQGQEFRAIFLSTSEPIANGKILNPTKSFSNRYVFNTAITRAQSLIVSVGNPFLLLRMEQYMIQTYGYSEQGKCWSTFLRECLLNETVKFDKSLGLSKEQEQEILKELQTSTDKQIHQRSFSQSVSISKDDALLARAFPPVTIKKKHKKRKRKRKKKGKEIGAGGYHMQDDRIDLQSDNHEANTKTEPEIAAGKADLLTSNTSTGPSCSRFKEEFRIIEKVDSGSYITQFHMKSSLGGEFIVKTIPLPTDTSERKEMEELAQTITQMDHPHIVKYHSSWIEHGWSTKGFLYAQSDAVLMLQSEVTGCYTLESWLKQHTIKRMKVTVINFFEQIVDALSYVSQYSCQSLNLKPSNIFLDPHKDDFLKIDVTELISRQTSGDGDSDSDNNFKCYMSPEVVQGKVGDSKADIYALGLIFFELNCPFTLEEDKIEILTQIKDIGIPRFFTAGVHAEVTSIIKLLLNKNPNIRPSAKEVIEDRYNYLKVLKKKMKRSGTFYVPHLSLVKTKKDIIKLPKEHSISVLLDHIVEAPPAPFQIDCPVCKDIMQIPYQVDCCGKVFCQKCIEKARDTRPVCPTCNQANYTIYHDKALQTALQQLKVYCPNIDRGCKWAGSLKMLDDHFNYNPSKAQQLEGCRFANIQCYYCNKKFCRSDIELHQGKECPMRPFSCQFCKQYDSTYRDIHQNHWPHCDQYPIMCEHKCGEMIPQKDYANHIKIQCLLGNEECKYPKCNQMLARKDMLRHILSIHTPKDLQLPIHQASQYHIIASDKKYYHSQQKKFVQNGSKTPHAVKQRKRNVSGKEKSLSVQRGIHRYISLGPQLLTVRSLVNPPQESFQNLIECPICLQIVKQPYQVKCCGKNVCKQCLVSSQPQCPNCSGSAGSFFNKGLLQILLEIYIHCPNKGKGCNWKGMLHDLDAHLNTESQQVCKCVEVKCKLCSNMYMLYQKSEHQCSECIVTCVYCKSYTSTFTDVYTNHSHNCEHFLQKCPRNCGVFVERQHLKDHLRYKCPSKKRFHTLNSFWSSFKWILLLLLHICPLLLIFPILTMIYCDHHSQELVNYGQEVHEICQEWNLNSLTISVTLSKTLFKSTLIFTCEVQNADPEWSHVFELCTGVKIVESKILNNGYLNIEQMWQSTGIQQDMIVSEK